MTRCASGSVLLLNNSSGAGMKSEVLKTNYFMKQRTRKLYVGEWTLFFFRGVCGLLLLFVFRERKRGR